ncbi:MAG TPA: ATP-binding protein [Dongiaceae bacterium]|jgi:PAS domain S-box-containing protein
MIDNIRMKALLIDDNPDDRALVLRELRKDIPALEPVHVIDADDFEAALGRGDFALVVTDYQLRWTDGLRVLTRIRERFDNVAVVMFTGTGSETIAVEAMQAGVDDYVVKSTDQLPRLRLSLSSAMLRAAQRAATRDQNARLSAILDNVAEGIVLVDSAGRVEASNPAAEWILGTAIGGLAGLSICDFVQLPGTDDGWREPENIAVKLDFLLGMGQQDAMGRRLDGTTLPVEISVSTAQLSDRRIYTFVIRDITERKRSEGHLIKALDEAREADRAKTSFLANMSHELRTPLNAILGFSSIIRQQTFGPVGDPHYAGYIDDIYRSAEHLLGVINDILDMAKVQAGHFALHPEVIDVASNVDICVKMMEPQRENAGHKLTVSLPVDARPMMADPRVLRQIALNLLSNAVKYTAPGGAIDFTVTARRGKVMIRVKDNGYGMPPEHLARIGEPFLQFSDVMSRRQGGTGLGLALVKLFAQQHGGNLHVESEVGVGTTITVTIAEILPRDVDQ